MGDGYGQGVSRERIQMTSYAKEIRHRVDRVRDDVIPPVARSAANYSERLAEGSEAFAESARKMADISRHWADSVTGARRRRTWMWSVLAVSVVGLIAYFMFQSNEA
jgi:hypothetical protein